MVLSKKIVVFTCLFIVGLSSQSYAKIKNILHSEVAREVLETSAGKELQARVLGISPRVQLNKNAYSEFIKTLHRSENAQLLEEIKGRVEALEQLLEGTAKNGGPEVAARLQKGRKLIIRNFSENELRSYRVGNEIKLKPSREKPKLEGIEFESSAAQSTNQLKPEIGYEIPLSQAKAPVVTSSAFKKFNQFVTEIKECTAKKREDAALNPGSKTAFDWNYFIQSVLLGQSLTMTGYYLGATGEKEVTLAEMSTDMLVSLIASFTGTYALAGATTFKVRYFRLVLFGEALTGVDTIIYMISPLTDTKGLTLGEATMRRASFEALWTLPSSFHPTVLYMLFYGLKCKYPGFVMNATEFGVRYVAALGSSTLYFRGRNLWMEK